MAQKTNDPGNAEPRASVPQEQDDELEMAEDDAEDDEDFDDDEDVDADAELEEDDVEE